MNTQLLIEIFTEELPAIPFLKEEQNIILKWKQILEKNRLQSEFEFFYTPRRLVLLSHNFPIKQEDREIELFGPPIEIAYHQGEKSKGLSKAGEGFIRKCGLSSEQGIQTIQKDGKEVLYFAQTSSGRESRDLLGEMIREWLESLSFGKSMRWGDLQMSFIRPIRNIAVLLGGESVDIDAYGLKSCTQTFVHRDCGFNAYAFKSVEEYLGILKNNGVVLDPNERKKIILEGMQKIEESNGVVVEKDLELLSEVVAITEYPKAVLGRFEEEFLELPKEVIITSMKENQRYFALYKDNKLYNGFIVVLNSMNEETTLMIGGNQKVLRARLSDAMFFYHNDLKNNLADYDLSRINFVDGLGSMQDKVEREKKIAEVLCQYNFFDDICSVKEAIGIAKSDLLCEMVGEFPELQGVMGEYYVLAEGKRGVPYRDEKIALACREQYMPNGEDDEVPSSDMGAIVALGYRLDLLLGLFSIGKIPSGSKDPFALRRSGNAIIRIVEKWGFKLNISMLEKMATFYKDSKALSVWEFLLERLEGVLKINASILRSVIGSGEGDLLMIIQKARALNEVFEGSDKEALVSTFKRVANITKDFGGNVEVSEDLFEIAYEHNLYQALQGIVKIEYPSIQDYIRALFALREPLDEFFDNVMVNVENERVRDNRKALVYSIYQAFLQVGDIKEISL